VRGPFLTFRELGPHGLLANQMFQVAATVGVARRNGLDFVFPPWEPARRLLHRLPQVRKLPPDLPEIRERDFAYRDIRVERSATLLGYFQSEKYFADCRSEILRLFAPQPELVADLLRRFAAALGRPHCSLHVRRGDYVGSPYWADLAASDYYQRAMARFDPDTGFLVFSDDINWCRGRFPGDRCELVDGLGAWESLVLMSLCRGHIIANSSFSWWGAWLDPDPGAMVIAPRAWFAGPYADPDIPFSPGPPHRGFHDTRDVVPERWLRI